MVDDKEDKKFKIIYVAVTSDRGNSIDVLTTRKRPDCIHIQWQNIIDENYRIHNLVTA